MPHIHMAKKEKEREEIKVALEKTQEPRELSILEEAQQLIYGDRNKVYKHPIENFENIANLWNAYFQAIGRRPNVLMKKPYPHFPYEAVTSGEKEEIFFEINMIDVAYMNILQKVARGATAQDHLDTIIDIAGYAGCVERILKNK